MKITQKITLLSLGLVVLLNGCAPHETAIADALVNKTMASSKTGVKVGNATVKNMLKSPDAIKGMGKSQVIGAQMMLNPAMLGVGALGTAISKKNEAKNKKAFGDITDLAVNSDRVNNSMQSMMVRAYNQKHGTHFKSFNELQDHGKIKGYNTQQGTNFQTLSEVRTHYNANNDTEFKTDQDFRDYIAANR